MPTGPVSYRLVQRGLHEVRCEAWGAGAQELVAGLPGPARGRDRADGFEPGHPLLAATAARLPGLRVPRTGRVIEALVPAVLEQKVTGKEARAAFRWLVLRHGTPAPGPAPDGMRVPADGGGLAARPVLGVAPRRRRPEALAHRLRGGAGRGPARGGGGDGARRTPAPAAGRAGHRPVDVREIAQRALATPTPSASATTTCRSSSAGRWSGRPLDDDGMVELLSAGARTGTASCACSSAAASQAAVRPAATVQDHRAH
jgi:hypothetical protein